MSQMKMILLSLTIMYMSRGRQSGNSLKMEMHILELFAVEKRHLISRM